MYSNHRPKTNNMTRGGQITFHNLRMWFQVNATVFKWTGLAVLLLTVVVTAITASPQTASALFYYWKYRLLYQFGTAPDALVTTWWEGRAYSSTLLQQVNNPMLIELNAAFWYRLQVVFLLMSLLGLVGLIVIGRYFRRQGEGQTEDHFIRGIKAAPPKMVTKQLKKKGPLSSFSIDGHQLFKQDFEVQHMLIDGTTGTGKSVKIRKLLKWIRARGDKAIVYDKGCTFVSKFYDPTTDVLLNPFDKRCAYWDIWCDAKEAPDFENMAAALIPQHGDGDPFWVDSARTIFSSTAFQMTKDKAPCSTTRLLHLILTAELETLGEYLKGTESATLVSNKIEKTAISIKSVLATYIKSLRFLDKLDETDAQGAPLRRRFSITDWVQDDNERGFLFLSSNAQQHASLRPLISMWLAIASNAILGLKEDESRRLWVIMDEMPSLHKLPELGSIIAEVRKFGGCYVIGIQSYAQLVKTYGKNAADEMFDLLNTRFYFRAPSAQMAQISSKDLGEQDIDVSKENISYGANTLRDGVSLGHQTLTRPVVSPSEIQTLDDLQCWARVPNANLVTRLDLKFDRLPDVCPAFIKREFTLSMEMNTVYNQLVYAEVMAPTMALDDNERQALFDAQSVTFESDNERDDELTRMRKASDQWHGDTQRQHDNNEHQRVVDEAAIAEPSDFEVGD